MKTPPYDSLTVRERIRGAHRFRIVEDWPGEGVVVLGYVDGPGRDAILSRMIDRGDAGPSARIEENPEFSPAIAEAVGGAA